MNCPQTPVEPRDHSRLMVVHRATGEREDKHFYDIIDYLNPNDALVINETKVIPARLLGEKEDTGVPVEVLLLRRKNQTDWEALVRPGRRLKPGTTCVFGGGLLKCEILESVPEIGGRIVRFHYEGVFEELLDRLGEMPLPPYIHEKLADQSRYQTVYAKNEGSVQVEDVDKHVMHSEWYQVTEEAANTLNAIRAGGGRLICVGTTSVRTIETVATEDGIVHPGAGDTAIFIYPGKKIKAVDALITNFHLPQSTLLMLVSTFMGRETALDVYREAVQKKYRFFSFGDAMFIE